MKTIHIIVALKIFICFGVFAQRTSPQIASRGENKHPGQGNSNSNGQNSNNKPTLFDIKKQIEAVEMKIEAIKQQENQKNKNVISNKKTSDNSSNQVSDPKLKNSKVVVIETNLNTENKPQSAITFKNKPIESTYSIVKIKRTFACAILKGVYFTPDRNSNFTALNENIQDQIDAINNADVNKYSPFKSLSILLDPTKVGLQNYICLNWNLDGCSCEKATLEVIYKEMQPFDFWDVKNKRYYYGDK